MAPIRSLLAICIALVSPSRAQFVSPPTDLHHTKGYLNIPVRWKQVPDGICELTPGVKSYSGYIDIAEDQHIFFWFFEARNQDPREADLTVWINGGPGVSSMLGLFQELGPCAVDPKGDLVYNEYAWNNVSNMLFIDQPVQVGFSYSTPIPGYQFYDEYIIGLPNDTCPEYMTTTNVGPGAACGTWSSSDLTHTANSTEVAAQSMWKTLQGFMGAFPQYSRSDFNFASESYGGHYLPVFNAYIEAQNKLIRDHQLPGAHSINLRFVAIGNGYYDPLIFYEAHYNFTVNPGNTYDFKVFNDSIAERAYNNLYTSGNCRDQILSCRARGWDDICRFASDFCGSTAQSLYDLSKRDEYDVRFLQPDPFPPTTYVDYLNSPKVQQAIGAFTNYSRHAPPIRAAFGATGDEARESNTIEDLRSLVQQGVYVVLYSGDADYLCNWFGNEAIANLINAPSFPRAGYANLSTSDALVHGVVKQADNFAFSRIYYSGHEVPFFQPLAALALFERGLRSKDIATGKKDIRKGGGYLSVGPGRSEFREGNDTVQTNVLPKDAVYNTTLNGPNPVTGNPSNSAGGQGGGADVKRLTS